jgi:hypothetical protein
MILGALQVIEIGQVGSLQRQPPSSAALSLFAHSQKGGSYGDATDIVSALTVAAQQEAAAAQVILRHILNTPQMLPATLVLQIQQSQAACAAHKPASRLTWMWPMLSVQAPHCKPAGLSLQALTVLAEH